MHNVTCSRAKVHEISVICNARNAAQPRRAKALSEKTLKKSV